jgi:hypothetical protein
VLNLNGLISAAILAFLGWLGMNMVDVKTELAVTHEKVSNVEKMVQPLWQEYISEKINANLTVTNLTTGE